MREEQEFIERRIVTGLIISTDYIDQVYRFWDSSLIESSELRTIANWCLDYYSKYKKAPDSNIESIYMEKLSGGNIAISKADSEYIEELLISLSDEYGRDSRFNSSYLYDQTIKYFKAQELEKRNREVQNLIDNGEIEEAEKLASSFTPTIIQNASRGIDLSSEEGLEAIEKAFSESNAPIITYPGALGEMLNDHLIRGGFVTFLAPEKRGKSFMLMEIALRAVRQKANVAFFEAGDMTQKQVIKRICAYIARRPHKEYYENKKRFQPVGDCIYNQLDVCNSTGRNCDHGIFEGVSLEQFDIDKYINEEVLRKKYDEFPDYEPCDSLSCRKRRGSVWIQKVSNVKPLTGAEAQRGMERFFKRYKRRFKLESSPAGLLTVTDIRNILNDWERYDGFVPDVIVVDYADLLSADDNNISEFRHRQDHVWKNLRALSQEKHALVLSATQADAKSYNSNRLSMSNFSEDKRKLAHVTAQYGLNQNKREKALGVMRINEIVVREASFSSDSEVSILQDLSIGRPFLESFS